MKFESFDLLPPEIRRHIWQLAFERPQIHYTREDITIRSPCHLRSLLQVCKEARKSVLSTPSVYAFRLDNDACTTVVHYANLNTDTIWFNGWDGRDVTSSWLDSGSRWVHGTCPNCHGELFECVQTEGCKPFVRPEKLLRFAMTLADWEDPQIVDHLLGYQRLNTLDNFATIYIRDFYLIVNRAYRYASKAREIVLITPPPAKIAIEDIDCQALQECVHQHQDGNITIDEFGVEEKLVDWTAAISAFSEFVHDFKEKRASARSGATGKTSTCFADNNLSKIVKAEEKEWLSDLSNMRVPKFTFVVAEDMGKLHERENYEIVEP